MCRELRMVSYSQHGSKQFCYNTSVSLKRDLLFDIGGRHPAPAIGPKPIWVDGKTPVGRDAPIAPPRGVAETHPTPAACTQQRIGASEETTTFYGRGKNTVLRRMAIMRRNLFSSASSRLVVVPLGNRVSRVRRFSFPRRSGGTRSSRRGKEWKCRQANMPPIPDSGIVVILSLRA